MMTRFPRLRSIGLASLAILLMISAGCGGNQESENTASSANATTVAFMHPDFRAAIVIRPQQLLSSELLATVTKAIPGDPVKEIVSEMTEELGLDPNKIDRLVLLSNSFIGDFWGPTGGVDVGFGEDGDDSPVVEESDPGACDLVQGEGIGIEANEEELFPEQSYFICAIVDLVDGVDATGLAKEFTGSETPVTHAKQSYYPQTGPEHDKPSVCVISDSSLLVAEEDQLKKILAIGNAQSPLSEALKQIDNSNDLSLVVLVGNVIEDIGAGEQLDRMGSVPNPFIPPQLSENLSLAKDIRAFTVGVNLKSDTPLQVGMNTSNAEIAGKFAGSLDELKKMGQEMIGQQDGEGNPIIEIATKALNGLTITNEKGRVAVALKMAPADLQAAVETLTPLLSLLGMGSSSDFDPGTIEVEAAPDESESGLPESGSDTEG